MKVTDNGSHVNIELETSEGQQTFMAGMKGGDDRRVWNLHPETNELASFIRDNQKFSQIFVGCNGVYKQVK